MKKLFAALAICVSTVAFAQDDVTQTEKQETKKEKKQEAPSAQQGSRDLELFEATELRSQKPGASAKKAKEEKARKDAKGIGTGEEKTVTEKAKDVVGLDEDDKAIGGSGTEVKTETKTEVKKETRKTKAKAKEAGEDTKGMAKDAAHDTKAATKEAAKDTKDATNEAAQDTQDAAKDTKNKMDHEMKQ